MSDQVPESNEALAKSRLENLVAAWNQSSFAEYAAHFTQYLIDHLNPDYFNRLRGENGRWLSNDYLGFLKQGPHYVYLWRSRFEKVENDVLSSITLTKDGNIAGLLKRSSKV